MVEGHSLLLPCRPSGKPMPTLTWKFEGRKVAKLKGGCSSASLGASVVCLGALQLEYVVIIIKFCKGVGGVERFVE